ncbi:hypothetical protein PHYPSEUDO_011531 [Phytophthora pseudosyringae]|uniref:Uncharacterized protein n=1 Tax=Phytophthora pseudosyringae TaxID=221518 RepID=A0A8T1VB47_9STRA|nr:hypothetical protein PHYPSEUDO_011531 [Phytophthora pseudosyringae]
MTRPTPRRSRRESKPPARVQDGDQRFVVMDLDSLLESVLSYVKLNERLFLADLAKYSDVGLDPKKITVILNGQKPGAVQCWRGTCLSKLKADATAFEAVTEDRNSKVKWEITVKSDPLHISLKGIMEGVLNKYKVADRDVAETNLGGGHMTLRGTKWEISSDRFKVKLLDKPLPNLLAERQSASVLKAVSIPFQRRMSNGSRRSSCDYGSSSTVSNPTLERSFEATSSGKHYEEEKAIFNQRKAELEGFSANSYNTASCDRFVFMLLENIAGAACRSPWLLSQGLVNNSSEARANAEALTNRICGLKPNLVKQKMVACNSKALNFIQPWRELSQRKDSHTGLHYVLKNLLRLVKTSAPKTLVLAMGDGALGGTKLERDAAWDLLVDFLDNNWFMEVHSWTHALSKQFVKLKEVRKYSKYVVIKPLDDGIRDFIYVKVDEKEVLTENAAINTAVQESASMASIPPLAWLDGSTCSIFPVPTPLIREETLCRVVQLKEECRNLSNRLMKAHEELAELEGGPQLTLASYDCAPGSAGTYTFDQITSILGL